MWLTTQTTEALAKARNEGLTLESVKAGKPADVPAADSGIGGTLEALSAVIPAGITAAYTGAVLLVRGVALANGTEERAATQAEMATAGKTASDIEKYLANIPLESDTYFSIRVLMLVVALGAAAALAFLAARTANKKATKKRKYIVAEPLTASIAFLGWALASPGTPLAAKYNADDTLVFTVVIALVAALVLAAAGKVVLSKKAKTEPET